MLISIIIPFQFYHEISEACIRKWVGGLNALAEYELLVSASKDVSGSELNRVRQWLRPTDKLLAIDHSHDMCLISSAVTQAKGDWLIISRAHSHPEQDLLTNLNTVINDHPDWSAVSLRYIPVTHNISSGIEARMYEQYNNCIASKYLDSAMLSGCFVIKRDVYDKIGGVDPRFGSFAEWVIAARLKQYEYIVGCDQRLVYYRNFTGDLRRFVSFIADSAAGEMAFCQQAPTDQNARLLNPPCELSANPVAKHNTCRVMAAMFADQLKSPHSKIGWRRVLIWLQSFSSWANWKLLMRYGVGWYILRAKLTANYQLLIAYCWIILRNIAKSEAAYEQVMSAYVKLGRGLYLSQNSDDQPSKLTISWLRWYAPNPPLAGSIGFKEFEYDKEVAFRGTSSSAAIEVYDFGAGITAAFETNQRSGHEAIPCFYLDGLRLSDIQVKASREYIIISIPKSPVGVHILSWVFPEFMYDSQFVWPLKSITIEPAVMNSVDRFSHVEPHHEYIMNNTKPIYFLHIVKTAGTTLRILLQDAFPAESNADPFNLHYESLSFLDTERFQKRWALYCSHLGWKAVNNLSYSPRTVTVLREPVSRLMSLFDFRQQLQEYPADLSFEKYVDDYVDDLAAMYFTDMYGESRQRIYGKGLEALSQQMIDIKDEAILNLRSCEVVGMQDDMDDTINLLCWKLGMMPPKLTPHYNRSVIKTNRNNISPTLHDKLSRLCEVDQHIYEEGRKLFMIQKNEMLGELSELAKTMLDSNSLREYLRNQFYIRLLESPPPAQIAWHPLNAFHGDGLHRRECHGGRFLRWTSSACTEFVFRAPAGAGEWELVIDLHPATPVGHLLQAGVTLNGRALNITHERKPDSLHIMARIKNALLQNYRAGILHLQIESPLTGGKNEYRILGMALTGIRLQPV